MRAIDPAMPGYARFSGSIKALATQYALSSSIELSKQEGDDRIQTVELDWLFEITGKGESHLFERRQAMVKRRLEKRGRKWHVISLDPPSFIYYAARSRAEAVTQNS